MKTLSVVIIGKNEEEILARGLESIKSIADEIVYIDTGGTDESVQIAKSYGSKIHNFPWINNFGKAYTFAHSKSTSDYTMLWDTDFVLDAKSVKKFLKLKENNFENADQVAVSWGLEYEEGCDKYGKLLKYIKRVLILKTGQYEYKNRCHPTASYFDKNKKIKTVFSDILVHHYQKIKDKKNRINQNIDLTILDLKDNPSDWRSRLGLVETYIGIEMYDEALAQIEILLKEEKLNYFEKLDVLYSLVKICIGLNKIEYCFKVLGQYYEKYKDNPIYILLCADILYFIDVIESKNMYMHYIKIRSKQGNHKTNIFRDKTHPEKMINKINKENKENKEVQQ